MNDRLINQKIDSQLLKPLIAVMGYFDAGKSSLINAIIEQDILPADLGPLTSAPIYLRYIDDRPHYLNETAYVISKDDTWSLNDCFNEVRMNEICFLKGDPSLIEKFGARVGENIEEVKAVLVYVESEILKHCILVDLPGMGSGDRTLDDEFSIGMTTEIDAMVYLSPANGFLRGGELDFFMDVIDKFQFSSTELDFSNIFVVASFADAVNKIDKIINRGAKVVSRKFNETYIEFLSFEELKESFYYHSKKNHQTVKDGRLYHDIRKFSKEYRKDALTKLDHIYDFLIEDKSSFIKGEIERYEDYRYSFYDKIVEREVRKILNILGEIKKSDLESIESFSYVGSENGRIRSLGDFAAMTNLKALIIPSNDIVDVSPIEELEQLEVLILKGCQCLGDIDPLRYMDSLTMLDLSENLIEDASPLYDLNRLTSLDLTDNKISAFEGGQLKESLSILKLNNNSISEISMLGYEELQILECQASNFTMTSEMYFGLKEKNFSFYTVDFESDNLRQIFCSAFDYKPDVLLRSDARKFVEIKLDYNSQKFEYKLSNGNVGVRDVGFVILFDIVGLEHFTNLQKLELTGFHINSLKPLKDLENLIYLDVSDNHIKDLSYVFNNTNLETLKADNNKIATVTGVDGLFNLRHLSLKNNKILELDPISKLIHLETLMIKGNEYYDNVSLALVYGQLLKCDFDLMYDFEDGLKEVYPTYDEYPEDLKFDLIRLYHNGCTHDNILKYLKRDLKKHIYTNSSVKPVKRLLSIVTRKVTECSVDRDEVYWALEIFPFSGDGLLLTDTGVFTITSFLENVAYKLLTDLEDSDVKAEGYTLKLGDLNMHLSSVESQNRHRFGVIVKELIKCIKEKNNG